VVSSEGFLEDITMRKQVEQALRESEEMFRNPVEQSPVGVFLVQDESFRYANPMLAGMLGYAREELIGKPFDAIVSPADMPRVRENTNQLLAGERGLRSVEFQGRRKDNSPVVLEVYVSSMIYQGTPALCGSIIDISIRRELEEKVARSLREKELLIKEIHHRVKNNLQVISSLLFLQARAIPDERVRDLLRESQNRVKSIALVHEKLYQSDTLDEIDYADYMRKIVPYLFETFQVDERQIQLRLHVGEISLPIDKAVPCSLIINEMISNSLKHAFPGGRKGTITIDLAREGEMVTLVYHDDGIGIPTHITFERTETLGMQLIAGYVNQLNGTITLLRNEGTTYTATFPA
jgi:PAS domain S-box-containing protein